YQALLGLQHIHEHNLIHRDLKPANLMLVPAAPPGGLDTTLAATVKILDFGLGRVFFDEAAGATDPEMQLTSEGLLLGTPDCLAREQARARRTIDVRADIYSLGGVLYHCLAGQPPFPDTNILGQMVRHATETPRPLRELNPDVPDGLQQVVNWMLAKDPAQRYPTPERAAQALQVFLAAGGEPARTSEEGPNLGKYLTWLEVNGDQERTILQTARPAPKSSPAVPAQVAVPIPAGDGGGSRLHGKKHKRHRHAPAPAAVPAAALPLPVPPEEYDVELVPALLPPKP